jgi:hypothetical protein
MIPMVPHLFLPRLLPHAPTAMPATERTGRDSINRSETSATHKSRQQTALKMHAAVPITAAETPSGDETGPCVRP